LIVEASNDASIEEYAARWLLRKDRGELQAEERRQFESWLAADSRHRQAFLALQGAWSCADGLKAWRPADGSIESRILLKAAKPRSDVSRHWAVAATVSAVAILVGSVAWLAVHSGGKASYQTEVGEYRRLVLDDGSLLQLNTDTEVKVDMEAQLRSIRMLKGEAHFEVSPNKQRPFQVTAGRTMVTAVGTAFTVRIRSDDEVEVLVTEGSVSLTPITGRARVSHHPLLRPVAAGEMADARPGSIAVRAVAPTELTQRTAWQMGELIFDGMRLDQVIAEFNRYSRRQLVLGDESLASLRVGGNFRPRDVDGFVRALQASFGLRAEETDGAIRIEAASGSGAQ
jgi:transmembrane sensor